MMHSPHQHNTIPPPANDVVAANNAAHFNVTAPDVSHVPAQNSPTLTPQRNLENMIETTVEALRQLTIIVEDFQSAHQNLLFDKVNALIGQFQELDHKRHQYDVEIPIKIFDFIDEGRNPDLYLQETLQQCAERNERTKGKIHLLEKLKMEIERQIQENFPEEDSPLQINNRMTS